MLVLIKSLLFFFSIFMGIFLILKTEKAIELQKKFYEKINWRIEPISLVKELRNTKIMGFILILIGLLTLFIR